MIQINIHEAKTNLSKLIRRVMNGEEVIIARAGRPVARLGPVNDQPTTPRKPGSARGQITIHDDFDAPLPNDIQAAFEGSIQK